MAWDAMLHKRFLLRGIASGQLYFQGFFKAKIYPRLRIPLPPISSALHHGSDWLSLDTGDKADASQFSADDGSVLDNLGSRLTPLQASMHLAKTVCVITGSKENIWESYRELFGDQTPTTYIVSSGPNTLFDNEDRMDPVRKAFEIAWMDWERRVLLFKNDIYVLRANSIDQ
jgi:hypothetical protein